MNQIDIVTLKQRYTKTLSQSCHLVAHRLQTNVIKKRKVNSYSILFRNVETKNLHATLH